MGDHGLVQPAHLTDKITEAQRGWAARPGLQCEGTELRLSSCAACFPHKQILREETP